MKTETIFITGSTGLIGRALLKKISILNAENKGIDYRVVVAVRNIPDAKKKLSGLIDESVLVFYEYNNSDKICVDECIDWIICAGAVTKKDYIKTNPVESFEGNVDGIRNCLEYAKNNPVKGLLFLSSCVVQGVSEKGFVKESENSNADFFHNPYACSKVAGELLCNSYFSEYDVPAKIARVFLVYGEDYSYERGIFLTDCINAYRNEGKLTVFSDGGAIRSFLHVEDAADALLRILLSGKAGETYNVGSEENIYSMRQLAELIKKIAEANGRKFEASYGNKVIKDIQTADLSKIKALGWTEKKIFTEEITKLLNSDFDK